MNYRLCRNCDTVKPIGEMHVRKDGKVLHECETCYQDHHARAMAASIVTNQTRRITVKLYRPKTSMVSATVPCNICGRVNVERKFYRDVDCAMCHDCRARLDDVCKTFTVKVEGRPGRPLKVKS